MKRFCLILCLVLASVACANAPLPLRQSTAITVLLPEPIVDLTDGYSRETGLTVTDWTAVLIKGATSASLTLSASGGDNDCVHVADGLWSLELTTANTNTLGPLYVDMTDVDSIRPVTHKFWVYPADTYDMLFTNGPADAADQAAATQVGMTAQGYTTTRAPYLDNINNADLATTKAQTGDAYARLGAPAGASVSADIAAVKAVLEGVDTVVDSILAEMTGGVVKP